MIMLAWADARFRITDKDCQITVAKGNKFLVSDMDGKAEGDYGKQLSINKKVNVSAKKPS